MTCSTCHDVHKPQVDAAAFSPHCLTCHQPKQCGEYAKLGEQIVNRNCIDCHMPLQESHSALFKLPMERNSCPRCAITRSGFMRAKVH